MDKFSFDPKSWKPPARKDDSPPPSSAATSAGTAAGGSAAPLQTDPQQLASDDHLPEAWRGLSVVAPLTSPTSPPPPTEEHLPEAWRGMTTAFVPGAAASAPKGSDGRSKRPLVMGGAMVAVAASAAAVVMLREAPPAPTISAVKPQAVAAKSGAERTERSLRIASAADITTSLLSFGVALSDAMAAAQTAKGVATVKGEIRLRALLLRQASGAGAPQDYAVERLQLSYADGSGAVLMPDGRGGFIAERVLADLASTISFVPGEIDAESFYASAVAAGVPDTLVPEFINAFGYDFNLASEVAPGDTFEVAFAQSTNAEGEAFGQPELLYAKLTTSAKSLALYRFSMSAGEAAWYDGNGATTKRGLMRTPVDGARITSKFGMRFHPTLHYNRLHGGVDFGAPTGTKIYAAADGEVIFAAAKGCNGNLTVLRHEGGLQTFYLHQNRWMPGIDVGARVVQGQHIGDVGLTPGGRCVTGPHLHYETHINGERVDPLSIPTDTGKRESLSGTALTAFIQQRNRIDVARAKLGI
jgi:murein DD-endopeptidase MepM/ murein hydrolase activator NlpD